MQPVDVIAMYSANGDILPLRLRMEDESHQLMRVVLLEQIYRAFTIIEGKTYHK